MSREARPARRLRRSLLALLAGFIAIVVLSVATDALMHSTGVFPPDGRSMSDGRWLLAIAYRIAFGIGGCCLAARLAPDRPLRHAMVLGGVGLAAGLLGLLATWGQVPELGPRWYSIAVAVIALPCGWVGGKLQELAAARSPSWNGGASTT